MNPHRYVGWTGDHENTERLRALVNWLRQYDVSGINLGTQPSAEHRRRSPRSVHNSGRAVDWRPGDPHFATWLLEHLDRNRAVTDVQLVLYRDWQFGGRAGPGLRRVRFDEAHIDHMHIEVGV